MAHPATRQYSSELFRKESGGENKSAWHQLGNASISAIKAEKHAWRKWHGRRGAKRLVNEANLLSSQHRENTGESSAGVSL